jgi:hypothetical protein
VSLACSSFRDNSAVCFPYGGTSLDPSPLYAHSNAHSASSYSLPRVDTIADIFKILYLLKASSSSPSSVLAPGESFPKPSAYDHLQSLPFLPLPIIDYALHILLVEILLFPQLNNQSIYDLQLHALQLFSVMPPEPQSFTLILQHIYVSPSSTLSLNELSSTQTLEAMRTMLLPLCQSLLRILSLQLIQASHLFKSPSRESHTIAAKLVPILVTHTLPHSLYLNLSLCLSVSLCLSLSVCPLRRFWNNLCQKVPSLASSSSL